MEASQRHNSLTDWVVYLKVRAARRLGAGGGVSFIAWPTVGPRGEAGRLSLAVTEDDLELLLLYAPALVLPHRFHLMAPSRATPRPLVLDGTL